MDDWLSAVVATPPAAAEAVVGLLLEAGASGLWEDLPDERGRPVFRAAFEAGQEMRLMAELPDRLTLAAEALELPLTDFELELEHQPAEDWSETWKKDLRTTQIAPELILTPSWLEAPPSTTAKILRLDPGSAFGSGRHPTTYMCLRLGCDLLDAGFKPQNVLDLGTGSGVLALAAALLSPEASVTAVDIDPDVLPTAQANIELNGLTGRLALSLTPLAELPGGYDLVLANLTLNALTELAPTLARQIRPDGRLIVSGLIEEQVSEAQAAFARTGFVPLRHLGRDEWSALMLLRSGLDGPLPGESPPARETCPEPTPLGPSAEARQGADISAALSSPTAADPTADPSSPAAAGPTAGPTPDLAAKKPRARGRGRR
ncbi:MAG: 50S ribosomal protein L11 methyltransferase [Deltaproteobacteria bacterium]|nr:50S ribosomal protein L11 methyltransferase [Deltaproteobacteria bacterium]